MSSTSIAKLRLLKDSIEQKKLAELKQDAAELGLSSDDVKNFGTLNLKRTWIDAIGNKIAQLFDAVEEGAIAQHGVSDRSGAVEPRDLTADTTITQTDMIGKNLPHLSLDAFRVPDEEIYPTVDPDENEDEEDEDEDGEDADDEEDNEDEEDEEEFDEATLEEKKAIASQLSGLVATLPRLTYYQLIAMHYGVLLAHQDVQPVADTLHLLGYGGRFSYSGFVVPLGLHEFVPDRFGREYLIRIIKGLKETETFKKPENCCPECDGLGNIFAGIAEHLIDWEACDVCDGKGFVEPAPPSSVNCPDCDATGQVVDFSGEDYETCPTCEGKRFSEPKTDPKLSQPEVKVNVRVCFPDTDDNSRTITTLATTLGGVCWCSGFAPEYEENWCFSSFQSADSFMQGCFLLPFVTSAICDRVSSNVPLNLPPNQSLSLADQASDLEKQTVIEWFRSEGSTPEELAEVQRQPMTKAEAAIVLGFAEHYKRSAEIALRLYLVDWVNDLSAEQKRCANRTDQLTILLSWKYISEAKSKLAHHFQLRSGEINCFITPDGWRISCPAWTKEEILISNEAEFVNPDDPVIQMMGDGYLLALEHFKKQVSVSLADLSPFPLPHETSSLA